MRGDGTHLWNFGGENLIKVKSLRMTTDFCPTQWEGETEDGCPIYIRYRWGHLSVYIAEKGKDPVVDGQQVISKYVGSRWCGVMSNSELKKAIKEITLPRRITTLGGLNFMEVRI